jgi:hypothetical protein
MRNIGRERSLEVVLLEVRVHPLESWRDPCTRGPKKKCEVAIWKVSSG